MSNVVPTKSHFASTQRAVKKLLMSAAIGLTVAATIACAPVKTLNAFVPDKTYTLQADIPYGDLPRQKLDIYQPKFVDALKPKQVPVVIFYYGGSWESGDKTDYKFVAEALASQGYIVVIPDYRVYPEAGFPKIMSDPAKAARWVKTYIKDYGGDRRKVFLAGHSSGAHLAVMLSLNAEYLARENLSPNDFSGTIGLAGPYDFLPLQSARLKEIFGPEANRWKSQPIEFVTGKNQPMLLLVGLKDRTVAKQNTYNLAAKIKAKKGPVKVVEFPDYDHTDMVAKLAKPLRGNGELLKPIVEFIEKTSE